MKSRLSLLVTIVLIACALGVLAERERLALFRTNEDGRPGPEEVIWRMTDAAREGNAQAYLACFTGNLEQLLRRAASEMGEAKYREHLKDLNAEVTGIAVSGFEETPGQMAGQVRVEFIYRGKKESQQTYVRLVDGQWRIERVDHGQRLNVLVPYGTSVKDAFPAARR
jgi:hypothetical protein